MTPEGLSFQKSLQNRSISVPRCFHLAATLQIMFMGSCMGTVTQKAVNRSSDPLTTTLRQDSRYLSRFRTSITLCSCYERSQRDSQPQAALPCKADDRTEFHLIRCKYAVMKRGREDGVDDGSRGAK
jgi:hypothetical protein